MNVNLPISRTAIGVNNYQNQPKGAFKVHFIKNSINHPVYHLNFKMNPFFQLIVKNLQKNFKKQFINNFLFILCFRVKNISIV